MADERFLTTKEVAAIYQVDQSTVRRWVARGVLPAYRMGTGTVRFARRDVFHLHEKGFAQPQREDPSMG